MIAMREPARFRFQPVRVLRLRSAHQRKRPVERVDDLLEVSVVVPDALGAPAPTWWQLPIGQVLRKTVRHAMQIARRAKWAVRDGRRAWRRGRTGHCVNLADGTD